MRDDLPELLSETEEDFVDLVFAVTTQQVQPDGVRKFTIEAIHEGERIGLAIELLTSWTPGTIGEDIPSFSGIVTYRSVGSLSNRFVSLLDQLYDSNIRPSAMNDSIAFAAITLGGNPHELDSESVQIKLFFEHDDEERCAEVYTNVDLPNGKIQIREKDEGYRVALIHALTSNDA